MNPSYKCVDFFQEDKQAHSYILIGTGHREVETKCDNEEVDSVIKYMLDSMHSL